jgi:hypothetical protein
MYEINHELEATLKSNSWDKKIANKVILYQRRKSKIIYSASGLISIAAIILVVFMFSLQGNLVEDYDNFINFQVSGTLQTVYGEKNSNMQAENFLENEETDQLIESVLALR